MQIVRSVRSSSQTRSCHYAIASPASFCGAQTVVCTFPSTRGASECSASFETDARPAETATGLVDRPRYGPVAVQYGRTTNPETATGLVDRPRYGPVAVQY